MLILKVIGSYFKSKNAIKRFKNDLKKSKNNNFVLDSNNYFKEGYSYKSELNDYSISVKLMKKEIDKVESQREINRRKLREKIRNMRGVRSSHVHQQAREMKKNIPKCFKILYGFK